MTANATQRVDVARLSELLESLDTVSDGDYLSRLANGQRINDACINWLRENGADLLQQLAEKDEALRVADLFQQLVIGEGAWERFQDLTKRAESAESKLAEQAAEIERLGECLRVFICDCQQWSYDSLDTEGGKRIALEWMTRYNGNKRRAEAAERTREEVERDALLMARWISNLRLEPWQEVDHACEQCRPGGEIVKAGFICGRHTAAAFLAANGGGEP